MMPSHTTKPKPTVFTFVFNSLFNHIQLNEFNRMTQSPTTAITHCNTTVHVNNWHCINQMFGIAPVHVFNILQRFESVYFWVQTVAKYRVLIQRRVQKWKEG